MLRRFAPLFVSYMQKADLCLIVLTFSYTLYLVVSLQYIL